ncbi:MAG: FAD-dependent oxidoreductase, partial [Acidobacteriota bacterium]|nr:FAD-dependent oxidoreductase [Acidobacteriota bacterium]
FPTRATQFAQVNAHKAFLSVFRNTGPLKAPWQLKAAVRIPGLQRLLGRLVGIGVRPEHIAGARRTPDRWKTTAFRVGAVVAAIVAARLFTQPKRYKI